MNRLLSFTGPEGDEARIMLKDLRTNHQEPSFSMHSGSLKNENESPAFSPWKRYNRQENSLLQSAQPLSSIRNPRRESLGSNIDPFDRFLSEDAEPDQHDEISQERSGFQFSRDDSRMSVESPFDIRK